MADESEGNSDEHTTSHGELTLYLFVAGILPTAGISTLDKSLERFSGENRKEELSMTAQWKPVAALVLLAAVVITGVAVSVLPSSERTLPREFIRAIETPDHSLTQIRLGPDDESLLAGSASGAVFSVRLESDSVQQLAPATNDPLTCLSESPDGLVMAAAASGRLRAWTRGDWKVSPVASPQVAVTAIAFGIEGTKRRILLGLNDGRIVVRSSDGDRIRETSQRSIHSLVVLPDGSTLIAAGSDGTIAWLDTDSVRVIGTFRGHRTAVSSLALSPDATQVASGDWDGSIRVLDVGSRKEQAIGKQPEGVSSLAWRDSGLISAGWDGHIRSWSVQKDSLQLTRDIDTGRPIHQLTVSRDGERAASVSGSSLIELWDLRETSPQQPL